MFRKVVESMEKMAVKAALKEGKLVCPDCGAKAGQLPAQWDQVMECHACGAKASLPEWVAKDGLAHGRADLPPATTKIRREGDGLGGAVWHIPAGGKSGFFFIFAAFWLGITVTVSGSALFSILTKGISKGEEADWLLIPFFGVFYAVGFGMLYVAIRQKFMKHRLTVSGGEVRLAKEMFGRIKEKSLGAGTVKSVAQKEFYQQNYKPVYGIEIKGSGGKLRFGSTLTLEEKAWLVADVKECVFGREEPKLKMAVPASTLGTRKEVFSVAMPRPSKHAWIGGLFFTLIGIGFMCIGIFVIDGDPLPEKREGASYVFDLVFFLFSNGFKGMWILFTSIFVIIGFAVFVGSIRGLGKDRRIEGNSVEISIRTYKRGLVLKNKSFPRNSVTDVRASSSGSSNGKPMKRVELIVGDKSEKLASWMDGDAADELVAEVRAALG